VRQGAGDVGAIRETLRRLRQGHVLNIYPEGARTEDGEIAALQKGIAAVVRRCDVPVVPAVIVGSFEAWPIHKRFPRSGPVRIRYGPPLRLSGLSPDEILATIDRTLRSMFDELRQQDGVSRRKLRRARGNRAAHLHQPPVVRGERRED
jgi:1-acyl-sn-glycerol-3-phosphate acyltransferase